MTAIESAVVRTFLWATTGAAVAVPTLIVPGVADPLLPGMIHLGLLGVFAIGLSFHLVPLTDPAWFGGTRLEAQGRTALTGIVVIAAVSAATVAAAVPTAIGLRYDASMQYFVVLLAAVVAGQSATMVFGAHRRFGPGAAVVAGLIPVIVGVVTFWRYLEAAGVGPGGSLVVDGSRMGTVVLPAEALAGVVALVVFSLGVRAER